MGMHVIILTYGKGKREKKVLGIFQKVNVLQCQNSILQQSPCVVVVGTGSSISQCSHVLHLIKACNIH